VAVIVTDLRREFGRKAFHMLTLAYLAAFHLIGYPRVLIPLAVWLAFVAAVETGRLASQRLNLVLTWFFRGIMRETEQRAYSGIFYTTAGCLAAMLIAGRLPRVVTAALLCLAFGDAAAALAGQAWGRHHIFGSAKSIEGSLACLLVCLGVGLMVGLGLMPAVGAALAATLVELSPTTRFFNDNLWMPVAAAAAAVALGAR
jgi:dolichol kinase